ncbi:aryldialkylphosphatase [Meridianimarinicoccus roseus]|uniref:Aryldialkylphosphatase n=1 Tax=Meridianimarinicoccus roseus TaxID=2072018 RepID=A0A2V2LGK6_9RHOB|nr:aryldialkylphosphatase [Meridianimarinicoccus roseus]PWR04615.1 aryldialkylphosphatase [Meridianimarinicoccus roseus]
MARVQTVLGDVDPAGIGRVAFHEHVLFDIVPPGAEGDREAVPSMEDRWQTDYRSNEAPGNAHQRDPQIAGRELALFREDGGSLIVDQSVAGLARDAAGLAQAARLSGVHVIAAAGCYTSAYMPPGLAALDVDALADLFTREVTEGLDGTGIRAGLIGEIGCSWPMHPAETRALRAAARAACRSGAALSVHPGRAPGACAAILDITEAEGLDPARTVLCHMDRTHPDGTGIAALLARGANVEWDFFGIEQSHYWMGDVDLPTDRDRIALIRRFADIGHADQILVSQDICTKTRLRRWGGHGYGHILRNVAPLMRRLGFDVALIGKLLRDTPLRLLTLQETPA